MEEAQIHPRWPEFYQVLLKALFLVFYHDIYERDIRLVLPTWRDVVRRSFSQQLNIDDFDIWDLITPTAKMLDFLNIYFAYLEVHEKLSTPVGVDLQPEEVLRRQQMDCVFPRPPMGTATSSRTDPEFYYVCPYCTRQDKNERANAINDHILRMHKIDNDASSRGDNRRNIKQLKRISTPVLRAIITDERRLFNLSRRLIRAARASVAELQGRQPAPNNDVDLDEEGQGLSACRRTPKNDELAKILVRERGVFDAEAWKAEVHREAQLAWDEAKKQERDGLDWAGVFC